MPTAIRTIHAGEFQPFASRSEPILKLSFPYDPEIVSI